MGAFDEKNNVLVPDDEASPDEAKAFRKKWRWDAHEVVILKGAYEAADHESVQNASAPSMNTREKPPKEMGLGRTGSAHIKMLERMIVDWTLAKNGRKVEVTPASIRRLPSNYTTPLLAKIDEISTGMSEEEQEDFLASANGHSQARSEDMSLSLKPF
jgi:hypothetical protein